MKTAPAMPPPRPPRDRNVTMGFYDWHNNPNAGRSAKLAHCFQLFAKLVVLALFTIAVGQLVLILFQIVRLNFFS